MTYAEPSNVKEVLTMLTYGRPHASDAEAAFVQRYVNPLPGIDYDKFGNGMVRIGSAPILWSCHTDTVHHKPGRQKVRLSQEGIVSLAKPERGLCLGADDGAGVWLASEMVKAGVSGLYVFHAGEEHGGLGSHWIAQNNHAMLTEFKAAIAFDRKGTTSVITHQMTRTASDAFGLSLAHKLGPTWHLDDTGTFTDTANYTNAIGECSNISVGYEGAHGPDETLDLWFLENLRNELVRFDPDGLIFEREPGDDDWDVVTHWPTDLRKAIKAVNEPTFDGALIELCRDYPEIAAELIERLGGNVADLVEAIEDNGFDLEDGRYRQ